MVSLLLFLACQAHRKIEVPKISMRSLGTIEARTQILLAQQYLLEEKFESAYQSFDLAHQSDPKNQIILELWLESLCDYPVQKQEESWTKLQDSLKMTYPRPSCLENK
jgi:hypothetical protein